MNKNFLDYTGLTKYTAKLEASINSKVASLVPTSRTVNNKPLTSDISLTADDVGAKPASWSPDLSGYVPTSRTINTKPLTSNITLSASDVSARPNTWTPTAADVGAVPTSRTVNGYALSSNVTLSASDVGARASSWTPTASQVGAVPTTRTVNGKALSSNITLTAEDIGVETPDLSGYVPTTRTVNGKALSSNITLTAANVSAVPTTRTVNGKALSSNITLTAEDIGVETPDLSTYAPKASPVFTGSISLGRKSGTTVGSNSFAVGYQAEASGKNSHAEGYTSIASGDHSHAEGYIVNASGNYSHAEGFRTVSSALSSHAENHQTTASGDYSHAEGLSTNASAKYSHAEGMYATANEEGAHAEGVSTIASNYASHASGKYNKEMTVGASTITLGGDVFVVGNGTSSGTMDVSRSNALRLAYEGTLYLTKAYNSTGADYAEYFEWLDGNPQNEDRVGRFVTLEGDKIKVAGPNDYILGVVSGQPCVIGNADEDWLGRWEHDDFNRFVKEYLVHNEVEVTPPEDVLSAANQDEALAHWLLTNDIQERDGHYFKMETEVVDYPTASWRHKANPAYDPSQPYVERKDRQEWDAIGMVGVLSVLDDGTCEVNGYAKVTQDGIATVAERREANTDTWRVVARVASNIVKIVFSIK